MANYADYLKPEEKLLDKEINAAGNQQETREESTPEVDWEKRYNDLNVAYSRQGQQVGDYRKLIDGYISTPEKEPDSIEVNPITPDDIYENPDEAVRRAVDSHPVFQKVNDLEKELNETKAAAIKAEFEGRHPKFEETVVSPEFSNWVYSDPMRTELANRAAQSDVHSMDALFTMYENDTAPKEDAGDLIDEIGLETATGTEEPAPDRYSRSDMLQKKIRAKQGDLEADAYVKRHASAYRNAMQQGNVRD